MACVGIRVSPHCSTALVCLVDPAALTDAFTHFDVALPMVSNPRDQRWSIAEPRANPSSGSALRLRLPWLPVSGLGKGEQSGGPKLGSTVPPVGEADSRLRNGSTALAAT